ncbi:DUF397 domain-containing protein [Streptomyces varsoviensis]|uniref:DUF397 domain-containing protein n=1 Tax=Streptomyces varsoviensis TaxID=67373 RepID=A0ABR5J6Z6_9ACTN|nr:DUF397 domain-containing protein [Streptomyces varsoviensis]KOG89185.1 hypothetical protein ADK38_15685 [Streptomyces varsoviensis]
MLDLAWQKSSFSTGDHGECVEVAARPGGPMLLRESGRPGDVVSTGPAAMRMLMARVKAGVFGGGRVG